MYDVSANVSVLSFLSFQRVADVAAEWWVCQSERHCGRWKKCWSGCRNSIQPTLTDSRKPSLNTLYQVQYVHYIQRAVLAWVLDERMLTSSRCYILNLFLKFCQRFRKNRLFVLLLKFIPEWFFYSALRTPFFSPRHTFICEWICRPCIAETKGLSPGASRGGNWGAAAGNVAGPTPPQSSGGNQWTQWDLLWWECQWLYLQAVAKPQTDKVAVEKKFFDNSALKIVK